jgi:ribosomal protein S25
MFSEGREDVNDEERAGRPSTSTTDEKIDQVKKMVLANRRTTVIEIAEDLGISIGSCHSILIDNLGKRRVAKKKNKNWLLHHDNAPAHISLLVRDFLAKNNTLMIPQPPYSPEFIDLVCKCKLKTPMKGRRYATIDEIKTPSKEELNKIQINIF